jgi:hypothetical protein
LSPGEALVASVPVDRYQGVSVNLDHFAPGTFVHIVAVGLNEIPDDDPRVHFNQHY